MCPERILFFVVDIVCWFPKKDRKFVIFCSYFIFYLNPTRKINVLSTLENAMNIQRCMNYWHLFDRDIKTVKPEAKSIVQASV